MQGRKMNVVLTDGAELPRYAHDGDAGFDLCITEDVRLEPNASAVCGLGFACEIPSGCVGLVFPRSGLGAHYGVTLRNSVGVIDSGYRGEVCAPLVNLSCDTVFLPKGSRVCQMVVVPFVPCNLTKVASLTDTERGTDGFGSTGID